MATVLCVWTQEEVQSVIRFLWAKGIAPIEIHRETQTVYGSNVMTVQHVRKWCQKFSGCHVSVTDEQRSGCPSTSADLVPAIEETVHANRRVLFKELEEQFNLSHGTIWDIVHDRSGYRKVCSRWVPQQPTKNHKKNHMGVSLTHLLHFNDHGEDFLEQIIIGDETWVHQYCPETKAQSMAWKYPGSPTFKKFKTSTSSGKLMVTVFWDMHGGLLLHFSPPNETVNSAAYQATLKKIKRAVQRKRPQMSDKRMLLLQDNAQPHTAHATVNLLERWGWEILEHPPYSPDLAPSDFHLFPNVKKHLHAKRFKSHDYIKHEVQT